MPLSPLSIPFVGLASLLVVSVGDVLAQDDASGSSPDQALVITKDYQFQPAELTVPAGTTVRWENHEIRQYHSVWFKEAGEEPGDYFFPGESVTRTFDKPGVYPYVCQPHEDRDMKGVIRVTE